MHVYDCLSFTATTCLAPLPFGSQHSRPIRISCTDVLSTVQPPIDTPGRSEAPFRGIRRTAVTMSSHTRSIPCARSASTRCLSVAQGTAADELRAFSNRATGVRPLHGLSVPLDVPHDGRLPMFCGSRKSTATRACRDGRLWTSTNLYGWLPGPDSK